MNLKNPVINGIYSWSIRKRQLYMYYTVTPMDTLPAFLDAYGQYSHQIIKLDIQPSLGWKLFDLSVSPKKAFDKYSPQQVTLKLK